MAWFNKAPMTSKAQSGTTVYPADTYRKYLMIVAGAGDITIALNGGDAFAVTEGNGFEPAVVPTSSITIVGVCTVVTNSTHV